MSVRLVGLGYNFELAMKTGCSKQFVCIHLQPKGCIKWLYNVDLNCIPWSVVMFEGIPNLQIQPFTNDCETDSAVILVSGKASGQPNI